MPNGMLSRFLIVAGGCLFMNTAVANTTVTETKFYTSPYKIENDEQARNLVAALTQMTKENLLVAKYHDKNSVEGYVEKLREYVLTKAQSKDVTSLGVTEELLHEIQRQALDQMACNDMRALDQVLKLKNATYTLADTLRKSYKNHVARAKHHGGAEKIICEITNEELAKRDEKIQALNSQNQKIVTEQSTSVSQASEKVISNETGASSLNEKNQNSVVGR